MREREVVGRSGRNVDDGGEKKEGATDFGEELRLGDTLSGW